MEGEAVQILHITDAGIELDVEAIENILHDENVRDKMVCVLSVAGAFRKGKSFILNFMLRYLENEGSRDWMGGPNEPLKGFDWRGGYKRNTTGILIWSKAFVVKTAYGEEVAIILMDTQGTFDNNSTMKECATVFALSSMISSVQVYNLSQHIQESDLHNLQIFTEYGRLAYETDQCEAPFQKLLFLVRDWQCADDVAYGIHGGKKYLKDILKTSDNQKTELKTVRQHIRKCINKVACFLMPFPGSTVASQTTFDGRLSGLEDQFKQQLNPLMHEILSPGKLIIKEIDGKKITAGQLFEYFKAYTALLQSEKLPTPMTIYETTAHANNQIAISEAKKQYMASMDKICSHDQKSFSSEQLCAEHSRQAQSAVHLFRKTKKMGAKEFCAKYEQILISQLDDMFANYLRLNELKYINEQEKIKHMKERAELQAKITESNKATEDVKNRMKEGEIAFQKQKEELERIMKEKNMNEKQMKEIIGEINRKHKEEQDELQRNMQKCQKQMENMTANMEKYVTHNKSEYDKLVQVIAQQEKDRKDLAQKVEVVQRRRDQEIGDLITHLLTSAVKTVACSVWNKITGMFR